MSFPSLVPMPPQYWKFNAGTGLWTDVCLQLQCVAGNNILQLTITDGGVGDLDGIANGMIRDPGGPGVSERPPDHTSPETVATVSPAPNAAGWNNTNVTVALTAQDEAGGSGVKEIRYALNGAQAGGGVFGGASTSVQITAEGTTTVTYFAVDNAGNQETAKTVTVRVDKTPRRSRACPWRGAGMTTMTRGRDSSG